MHTWNPVAIYSLYRGNSDRVERDAELGVTLAHRSLHYIPLTGRVKTIIENDKKLCDAAGIAKEK